MSKSIALCLLLAAAVADAHTVWRCGADGRSFSDRPCAEGQPLRMAALADTRSAAEVQAAHEVAARDKALANSLRLERLERERVALPATGRVGQRGAGDADRISRAGEAGRPRSKVRSRPRADDGTWRAVAPSSRGKRGGP